MSVNLKMGSGARNYKMLLVKINDYNKTVAYFRSVTVTVRLGKGLEYSPTGAGNRKKTLFSKILDPEFYN